MKTLCWCCLSLCVIACEQKNPYASKPEQKPTPPSEVVGIDPDSYECETFLSSREVATIVGGEVFFVPSDLTMPGGIARPCNYQRKEEADAAPVAPPKKKKGGQQVATPEFDTNLGTDTPPLPAAPVWGIQFDCRPVAHPRTDSQIQGLEQSASNVKPLDIGKKALEHSGAQVIFIDDKTPCAVTITGPDAEIRAKLARLVHHKLTLKNAPMRPYALKTLAP